MKAERFCLGSLSNAFIRYHVSHIQYHISYDCRFLGWGSSRAPTCWLLLGSSYTSLHCPEVPIIEGPSKLEASEIPKKSWAPDLTKEVPENSGQNTVGSLSCWPQICPLQRNRGVLNPKKWQGTAKTGWRRTGTGFQWSRYQPRVSM